MKKLLFTAMAVVAFSGVAMAGTLEVKVDKILFTACEDKAMDQLPPE